MRPSLKHLRKVLRMTDGVNYADLSREVLLRRFYYGLQRLGIAGLLDLVGAWSFIAPRSANFFLETYTSCMTGKMNKAATQLYKEFENHLKA